MNLITLSLRVVVKVCLNLRKMHDGLWKLIEACMWNAGGMQCVDYAEYVSILQG